MPTPLAAIIKLLVHPRFVDTGQDRLETIIPVLRRAGSHRGTLPTPEEIDLETAGAPTIAGTPTTTGVAFLWAAQIYRIVPAIRKITYDTAAGRVEVQFDSTSADAQSVIGALDRLVNVAIDTIGQFLLCDKRTLRTMAQRFASQLEQEPIDLKLEGTAVRLRRLANSILSQTEQ